MERQSWLSLITVWMLTGAASAASLTITCPVSDTIGGGTGPMTVTYDGDATGTVTIASQMINVSIPAKKEVRARELDGKPHTVTGITGSVQGEFTMPDRAALEACTDASLQPEFKDDPDMYAIGLLSCVKSTPPGTAPAKANASVSIALVPGAGGASDVVVEIKRTYLEKSSAPGGTISLDTFPGQCALQ